MGAHQSTAAAAAGNGDPDPYAVTASTTYADVAQVAVEWVALPTPDARISQYAIEIVSLPISQPNVASQGTLAATVSGNAAAV